MVVKKVIGLANVILLIAFVLINHFEWLNIPFKDEQGHIIHENIGWYFTCLFSFVFALHKLPKSDYKLIDDLTSGYLLGWAIENYLVKVRGVEEGHISEVLAVIWPLLGHCWRKYRKKTELAVAVSLVSYLVKIVSSGIVWVLNKLFL